MPTTFTVLSLGNLADIGTTEFNNTAENASALVGLSFGDANAPLVDSAATWSAIGSPGLIYNMNNAPSEQFSIDGGPAQTFDGTSVYNATLTFTDGSTATISAVVAQDTAGNAYLVPEFSPNVDQAALESGIIQSLELNSLLTNSFSGLATNRQDWDLVTCFTAGTLIDTSDGANRFKHCCLGI